MFAKKTKKRVDEIEKRITYLQTVIKEGKNILAGKKELLSGSTGADAHTIESIHGWFVPVGSNGIRYGNCYRDNKDGYADLSIYKNELTEEISKYENEIDLLLEELKDLREKLEQSKVVNIFRK